MIIIGINGPSGAGKSTVSDNILKGTNKKIIHLDNIFNSLKNKLPTNTTGLLVRDNNQAMYIIDRKSMFFKITHLKFINKSYERLKKIYANKYIRSVIKKSIEEDLGYLIIEGSSLEMYDISYLLNYLIFVSADKDKRVERVLSRDKEFSNIVIDNYIDYMPISLDELERYNFQVYNNGTFEELLEKCDVISNKIKENRPKSKFKACKLKDL